MAKFRVWLLRVHGTLLVILGLANAAMSTYGLRTGEGLMGFLRDQRLGHVGLMQAYLLAAVLGIVLWMGSRRPDPRPWNRIGALVHLAILPVYVLHWDYFPDVSPDGNAMRNMVALHVVLLVLESIAGFSRLSGQGRPPHPG